MNTAKESRLPGEIPAKVTAAVLLENFRRRSMEAYQTNASNFDDESTWRTPGSEALQHYIEHRMLESEDELVPSTRVDQFTKLPTMVAYELFARLRVGERNLLDTTFALGCLRAITDSRNIESIDERIDPSYPKLTRIIPDDDRHFGVVTTKLSVGSFSPSLGDTIHLKSRQAGVIITDNLSEYERTIVDTLAHHEQSMGRTDELMATRAELHAILAQPDVALPIVESLYLTRLKKDL